jgi:hypothetical protein
VLWLFSCGCPFIDVGDDCGFKNVLHGYWNAGNCLLSFVGSLFQLHFDPFFNVRSHWGDVDLIPDLDFEKIVF